MSDSGLERGHCSQGHVYIIIYKYGSMDGLMQFHILTLEPHAITWHFRIITAHLPGTPSCSYPHVGDDLLFPFATSGSTHQATGEMSSAHLLNHLISRHPRAVSQTCPQEPSVGDDSKIRLKIKHGSLISRKKSIKLLHGLDKYHLLWVKSIHRLTMGNFQYPCNCSPNSTTILKHPTFEKL